VQLINPIRSVALLLATFMITSCGDSRPFPVGEMVMVSFPSKAPQQAGYIKGQITKYHGESATIKVTEVDVPKYNEGKYAGIVRAVGKGEAAQLPKARLEK